MISHTLLTVFIYVLSLAAGYSQPGTKHGLHRRINEHEFQPDDPRLFDAIKQLFGTLKVGYGNNDVRFVVGGSIAVNHWFPANKKTVKDIDLAFAKNPATNKEEGDELKKQAREKVAILDTNFTLVNQVELMFAVGAANEDENIYVDWIPNYGTNKQYIGSEGTKLSDLPSPIDVRDDRLYARPEELFTAALIFVVGLGEIKETYKRKRKMDNSKANFQLLPTKPGFRLSPCQLSAVDYCVDALDKAALDPELFPGNHDFYDDVIDILVGWQKQWGVYEGELKRRKRGL